MIRILFTYVLPLVLPTALYFAWSAWVRRRQQAGEAPPLAHGPWFALIIAGFVLLAASLAYTALTHGTPPGGVYQTPRLGDDGRIIPGGIERGD